MYLYIVYLFDWPVFCWFVRTPIFRVFGVTYLYFVEHQFLFVLLCTHLSLCSIHVPNYFSHPMWCTPSLPSEWQSLRRSLPRNDHGKSSSIFRDGKNLTKNVGMSPGLFTAMMSAAPWALLEYPKMDEKSKKYLPFHSKCSAMFSLNIDICSLGGCVPDSKTFYHKNKVTLAHVLQHMAFVVITNSSSCSEEIPASYMKPPTTAYMQRFDDDGTELSTLENPNFPKVHYVAFKRVYSHNLFILH